MDDDDLCHLPLVGLAELIARGEVAAAEATEAALRRIELLDSSLNAFVTVTAERARTRARELDEQRARGGVCGPLHGIPVSLKDNLPLAGVRTTAGSALLRDWVPSDSALVCARVEAAGAVVVGKTNLWEFAYGAPSPLCGPAVNPWDASRTTGASSSGSAVAVAAGLCFASLGTDSGGSVRIPASFCGVVGLKPTRGLLPTAGAIPVSHTLDHVGPLARTVEDAQAVFAALAGTAPVRLDLDRSRIGFPARHALSPLSPDVATALEAARQLLVDRGARVEETSIPDLDEACSVKWTITGVEAARYHAERYGPPSDAYHPAVRRLLEQGAAIGRDAYEDALRRRAQLTLELEASLAGVDALVLPATPAPALLLEAEDEGALRETTHYTSLFNVTGSPALVVPFGMSPQRLPVGLQLVGRAGSDAAVLALGAALERARGPLPRPLSSGRTSPAARPAPA
jgi:aspartyl-tRNA(Asn)/glutamyl-tRNA(Gln) amidotransferase subunit A